MNALLQSQPLQGELQGGLFTIPRIAFDPAAITENGDHVVPSVERRPTGSS
jgi:hypothetical protein